MRAVEELRRRPFLIVAAPAAAGIVAADALPHPATSCLVAAGCVVLACLLFRSPSAPRLVLGWTLIGLAAGLARGEWSEYRPRNDIVHLDQEAEARIVGEVVEAPVAGSFPLEIETIEIDEKSAPWTGRIRVRLYRQEVVLTGGERIAITGRLRPLRPPTNPGVYDWAAASRRRGLGATFAASEPVVVLTPPSPFRLRTMIDRARAWLRGLLARHAPPEVAALQSALLFGSREDLPEDLTLALQRSGTAHFLAVSGFNLVLVLTVFWFLLLGLGVRGASMPVALLVLLFFYTALTGWQVSVVRAFLMSATILAAKLVWRRADVINSLSIAALAILMWDPGQIFDTGFQLSFVAVLGIVGVGPIYHEFLAAPPVPPRHPVPAWLGRQARAALAVSIGAWLTTAPIVLATFNLATPVILIANLALCPLVTLQAILALAAIPLALLFPTGASAVGWVATGVFQATSWTATFLTGLPFAYLFLPAMPAWMAAAYYVGLGFWTWRARAAPTRGKPWLCAAFAGSLAIPALVAPGPACDSFGCIDVGRGSCAYLRSPDTGTVVFDCGSLSYRDVGAAVAAPVLWSRGVTRVHTLVISHSDADHVNGARSLIERMRVARLVVPPGFNHPILDFARLRGVEVIFASRGRSIPGLEILGPPPEADGNWPVNDRSLVVRVSTLGGTLLIPGDIEELGSRALLDSEINLAADVFVLPHHGKRQDFHRELIEAVSPRIAVASAPEGYASREVLDRARRRADVYQTGITGWLEIELDPKRPPVVRGRGK